MRRRRRSDHMVLQRYSLDGQFHSEERIRSVDDENYLGGFAGVGSSGPVILVKWKKRRWTVEKLDR